MTAPNSETFDETKFLDIDIVVKDSRWVTAMDDVIETCRAAACAAFSAGVFKPLVAEAAVVLAGDDFVAALNRQYRNRDGATNVLSFAATGPGDPEVPAMAGAPVLLGDIVVARETTAREAAAAGISIEHHLRHLVVHGMLHLLGFDHMTDDEAAEMEPLETQVLATMGVTDPYRPAEVSL
jgi:probable rRNA maturation factor